MKQVFYLFLISLCLFTLEVSQAKTKHKTHPLIKEIKAKTRESKKKHLSELFNLYSKLQNKHYKTLKELQFRKKIFKENLNKFIMKEDDVMDRIEMEQSKDSGVRLLIIPDKRLSVDFYVDEEETPEDHVQFELNQFSDLSEKEFDNLYLLDQSYFDESKYPVKYDDLGFSGISNIRKYLKKLEKTGFKHVDKYKQMYAEHKQESADEGKEQKWINVTPHFSTSSEEDEAFFSESNLKESPAPHHSTFFNDQMVGSRQLQAFRTHWGRGPSRWNNRSSYTPRRYRESSYDPSFRNTSYLSSEYGSTYDQGSSSGRFIPEGTRSISIDGVEVPTYLNWEEMNGVTPIKNQYKCNACYAFAGIGALECHYKIKTGRTVSLSEQEIVDCSRENNRCIGGLPHLTFDYIRRRGISFETHYPYDRKRHSSCRRDSSTAKFSGSNLRGYTNLRKGMLNLIKALSDGPVATISYASFPFKHYRKGIYRGQGCYGQSRPNHSSVLIGYKLTGKKKYLLFKNGWGTKWGLKGYYKVELGLMTNRSEGHCMIAKTKYNSIPRV